MLRRAVAVGSLTALLACSTSNSEAPRGAATASASLSTSLSDAASPPSSAPAVAAVPAPPTTRKGAFIWEFGKNAPAPAAAAELLAKWGFGRVFIKSSEGAGGVRIDPDDPKAKAIASPPALRWPNNMTPAIVREFTSRGIEVWAFGYFYPDRFVDPNHIAWGTLEQQATMSAATLSDGVTGLVVDAEAEFYDRADDATKLCKLLRAKIGKKKLAYTTFGWLSAHPRFPFKELDKGCGDAFLPQVYYEGGWPGGALGSLAKMRKDRDKLSLTAPLWPIQSNERNPKLEDVEAFFDDAGPDSSIFYLHPAGSPQNEVLERLAKK